MATTITIQGYYLEPIIVFLQELTLYNKASRGRSKLIKVLTDKQKELQEEVGALIQEYAVIEENGEPKIETIDEESGVGRIVFKEGKENKYLEEYTAILAETLTINLTEHLTLMAHLLGGLDKLETPLSKGDSEIYNLLCEKLENLDKEPLN